MFLQNYQSNENDDDNTTSTFCRRTVFGIHSAGNKRRRCVCVDDGEISNIARDHALLRSSYHSFTSCRLEHVRRSTSYFPPSPIRLHMSVFWRYDVDSAQTHLDEDLIRPNGTLILLGLCSSTIYGVKSRKRSQNGLEVTHCTFSFFLDVFVVFNTASKNI